MKKQSGIALFFTLIILLITTLIGVSAAQQNNVHLLMAENFRSQTFAFGEADNTLTLAEDYVRSLREADSNTTNNGECKTTDGEFTPAAIGSIPLNIDNVTASVQSCHCLAAATACSNSVSACLAEIYTIRLEYMNINSSIRTVESHYAVRCDVGVPA